MTRLAIYLNDHLAGSLTAVELARRAASQNRGNRYGETLAELLVEIQEDRSALRAIMSELGIRSDPLKLAAAWTAEKFGRLKLNGSLIGYSPLSRLVELEFLAIGVTGKMLLWEALIATDPVAERLAGFDLKGLKERASRQLETLRRERLAAASEALA